ncbi:invasion associated locus B family protein [Oceanibium sediminis]|uniref:invasion associated locus B family protein n=1 Tax=Oceanibium sediminis TaxID=2026339 RepID=UPI000DD44292|nr:invasion associated locus B family protein [Oceanibium sediminis]
MTFFNRFTSSALALVLMASPLSAQTTTEETAPEAEAAAEEATPAEPQADAPADPASGEESTPDLPENLSIEAFGDWELRCETTTNNCFMYQLARDESLNPVSELSLVALPESADAALGVTAITPLGTLLSEGLVLQVDSGAARQYPFSWCTRSGCFARFGMTASEVDAMKRGATARLRILSVSAPEDPVILNVSLSGFTAAYEALTSR